MTVRKYLPFYQSKSCLQCRCTMLTDLNLLLINYIGHTCLRCGQFRLRIAVQLWPSTGRELKKGSKLKNLTNSHNARHCSGFTFDSEIENSQRDEEEKRPSFLRSRGASVSTLQSFIFYLGAIKYCRLCSAMISKNCALRAYSIPSMPVANPTEPAHPRFL